MLMGGAFSLNASIPSRLKTEVSGLIGCCIMSIKSPNVSVFHRFDHDLDYLMVEYRCRK